jgi:protein-disulfide isomerase
MSKKNRTSDRTARAAAALAERQRQERRRRTLMIGGVVTALVLVILVGYLISRSLDTTGNVDAPAAGSKYGLTIGPDNAPHEVVVYEDFLCPFCGEFESKTRTDLAQLAADGKVQVEYRPFNFLSSLGDYSARSAGAFSIVLDRAGPDVAKKFHDLLFENQPDESGPFPSDDDLVQLAVQAGAEESKVRGPITANAGKDWVNGATQSALDAGVRATPTIVLDGKVFTDGRTVDELAQNLLDQLG